MFKILTIDEMKHGVHLSRPQARVIWECGLLPKIRSQKSIIGYVDLRSHCKTLEGYASQGVSYIFDDSITALTKAGSPRALPAIKRMYKNRGGFEAFRKDVNTIQKVLRE